MKRNRLDGDQNDTIWAMAFRLIRLAHAATKASTGLVGLRVDPNARKNLVAITEKLLEAVKVRAN